MNNNAPVALLNDFRKHSERGRQTRVPIGEDVDIGTLNPGLIDRSVDRLLHVFAIEINWRLYVREGSAGKISLGIALKENDEASRETEDIPQNGILQNRLVRAWTEKSRAI